METTELIYHIAVMLIALVAFFMKWRADSTVVEIILVFLGKAIPLFCIFYSGIQICKYIGLV